MRALKLGIILVLLFVLTAGRWGEVGNSKWGQVETASSGGFSPADVAGIMFWYDAALGITKDGSDLVSAWADQSGNDYHLLQATDTNKPLWQADQKNGYPAVQFDGVNDWMRAIFGATYTQPNTIFIVFKDPTYVQSERIYAGHGSNADFTMANNKYILYAGVVLIGTQATGGTSWRLNRNVFSGDPSYMYFNGVAKGTGNAGNNSLIGFTLGAIYGGTGEWGNPNIAEAIGYNANVSAGNCALIKAYLNAKYEIY